MYAPFMQPIIFGETNTRNNVRLIQCYREIMVLLKQQAYQSDPNEQLSHHLLTQIGCLFSL